jgi:hypothetical protein
MKGAFACDETALAKNWIEQMIGMHKWHFGARHPMLGRRALDTSQLSSAIDKDMSKSGAAGNGEDSSQIIRAKSEVTQRPGDDVLRDAIPAICMRNTIDGLHVAPRRDAERNPTQWTATIV